MLDYQLRVETKIKVGSTVGSAADSKSEGRGFESCPACQEIAMNKKIRHIGAFLTAFCGKPMVTNVLDNYPSKDALYLIDDIKQEVIMDEWRIGCHSGYPPVCTVWSYKDKEKT